MTQCATETSSWEVEAAFNKGSGIFEVAPAIFSWKLEAALTVPEKRNERLNA
jgi:hypothetical protein